MKAGHSFFLLLFCLRMVLVSFCVVSFNHSFTAQVLLLAEQIVKTHKRKILRHKENWLKDKKKYVTLLLQSYFL